MSEPVLRAQLPIPTGHDPAGPGPAGVFTNHGGVSRYTVTGQPQEQQQQHERTVTRPSVGGVLRATMTTNPDGTRTTTTETGASISRAPSGDAGGDAPRFTSSGGRSLMPNEIGPTSLVTVGGVTTNVRAAVAAGLIRQNASGVYESATGAIASTGKTEAQQLDEANAQRLADQEQAEKDAEPKVERLDDAGEAVMDEAVKIGSLDRGAAIHSFVETGALTPDITNRIATQLGTDPAQVSAQFETLRASFLDQASKAIGPGAQAVLEWANQPAQMKDLKAAVAAQINQGTTDGYKVLAANYYASLDSTPAGRALILGANNAAAYGVSADRNGKITVNVPGVGKVAWSVAVRQGLIPMPHGSR